MDATVWARKSRPFGFLDDEGNKEDYAQPLADHFFMKLGIAPIKVNGDASNMSETKISEIGTCPE